MPYKKTPVYFVPGMAAGREIFKHISLPEHLYDVYILDWLIPKKNEPIAVYARRMADRVVENDAVLIGVSFGGVVVQEMASFLNLKKLIIISSVKTKKELPMRLKIARKTGAYKLIPTRIMLSTEDLTKFAIGPKSRKRLELYQAFLNVRDQDYLDWAIKNMVCWQRNEPLKNVIHIHGDKDIIFPIKNIKDCMIVEGGTHIMLLNKGKKVTEKILEAINS